MSRYHINPHNYRRYAGAFYDDECVECAQPINEGDPIGFLNEGDGRYGPICEDCLTELAEPMEVKIDG